jgi:hypothetical protein
MNMVDPVDLRNVSGLVQGSVAAAATTNPSLNGRTRIETITVIKIKIKMMGRSVRSIRIRSVKGTKRRRNGGVS